MSSSTLTIQWPTTQKNQSCLPQVWYSCIVQVDLNKAYKVKSLQMGYKYSVARNKLFWHFLEKAVSFKQKNYPSILI